MKQSEAIGKHLGALPRCVEPAIRHLRAPSVALLPLVTPSFHGARYQASFSESDYIDVRQQSVKYDVFVMTYTIGSGAATTVAKRLACENRGVFYPVPCRTPVVFPPQHAPQAGRDPRSPSCAKSDVHSHHSENRRRQPRSFRKLSFDYLRHTPPRKWQAPWKARGRPVSALSRAEEGKGAPTLFPHLSTSFLILTPC